MQVQLQQTLTLLTENTQALKKEFRGHDALDKRMAALVYALADRPMDVGAMREQRARLKEKTGAFSSFRMAYVTALLALNGDCDILADALDVYALLKKSKLQASEFSVMAACHIAAHGLRAGHHGATTHKSHGEYPKIVAQTRAFYDAMKVEHRFLTGAHDYIFAAMMGISGIPVPETVARMEVLFGQLKPEIRSRGGVRTLAQVLVLAGAADQALPRVIPLRNALRARRIKMESPYNLPMLGVLAGLPVEPEALAAELQEAQAFLRAQKDFGKLYIDTQPLLLFCAAVVASTHANDLPGEALTAAVVTGILNTMAAQQAALMAAVAAST